MNELVTVDPKEYGLEETKARDIEAAFKPMLEKMTELEGEYNEVMALPEGKEMVAQARELRLKYVKVRTGTAKIHKTQKAYYLSAGRCLDGWKNAQLHASQGIEENLKAKEDHFINMEKARLDKLQSERADALREYEVEFIPENLSEMEEDVWENYLTGTKDAFNMRVEAERIDKEKRIAKQKADAEERERIRLDNERLQKEAADRENAIRKERAEMERVNAARQAKQEEERKAIEEKARKEREAAEAKLAEERAERERLEQEERNRRELERIDAEKKAQAQAEEAKRVADVKHRKKIEALIIVGLMGCGVTDQDKAQRVLESIKSGVIPNVTINY